MRIQILGDVHVLFVRKLALLVPCTPFPFPRISLTTLQAPWKPACLSFHLEGRRVRLGPDASVPFSLGRTMAGRENGQEASLVDDRDAGHQRTRRVRTQDEECLDQPV